MLEEKRISWTHLIILSSVTFLAILSELVPTGVLTKMSSDLNVSNSYIGFLIGIYAIASAVGTIPLVAMTVEVNRKKLLVFLLLLFGISNAVICFTSNYNLILFNRLLGGIAAGILWPMIAAYAVHLVPASFQGRAIAITMAGSTLGLGIGMPFMTAIGTSFGWRAAFAVLTFFIFTAMLLVIKYLPTVEGEKKNKSNSPFFIIKDKGIILCLILTFLAIMAHYALYTYISLLTSFISISGGIKLASIIFGIGTIVSVVLAGKFIDTNVVKLSFSMLVLALVSLFLIIFFKGIFIIHNKN